MLRRRSFLLQHFLLHLCHIRQTLSEEQPETARPPEEDPDVVVETTVYDDGGYPDGFDDEKVKYTEFALLVDPDQDDKATELKLRNFARPHMRAFHYAWWSFFIAFFIWFSIGKQKKRR